MKLNTKNIYFLILFFVCSDAFADRRFDPSLYRAALRTPTEKKQALSTTNTVVKVVQKVLPATNTVSKVISNIVNNTTNTLNSAPTEIKPVVVSTSIKINGSSDFVRRINEALALLLAKDTKGYQLVISNLNGITENKTGSSNSFVDTATAITYILPIDASNIFWLASALVHESKHVELYRTGQTYWGTSAELVCIRLQTETMINIGGPQYLIDYLKSLDGTHWMQATR